MEDYEEFSCGFSAGNYASAYSTEDYALALAQDHEDYDEALENLRSDEPLPYRVGHLLGFFSSYELHEVPDDWRRDVRRFRCDEPTLKLAQSAGVEA